MKLFLLFLMISSLSVIHTGRIVLHTRDHALFNFFPLCTNYLEFNTLAPKEIFIILTNSFERNKGAYEFIIGGWENKRSVIRKDLRDKVDLNATLVQSGVYQKFWVKIDHVNESVSIGMQYGKPLMIFHDPNYVKMSYFGLASGQDQRITWDFDSKMVECP